MLRFVIRKMGSVEVTEYRRKGTSDSKDNICGNGSSNRRIGR